MSVQQMSIPTVVYDRYELPLMVVENGFGAFDKVEEDGLSLIHI